FVIRSQWFKLGAYVQGIDKASIFQLIHYAIISFTPILIVPLSSMILRKCIVHELSWQEAGYWQGIMKLSDGYLILMELVISVYFLPKISGTNVLSALKAEIFNIYRLIVPIALLGLTCVFLFKQTIVSTVYSEQFFPMLTLFKYQLIGDFTRILAWVLTSVLAAKAMVKILVFSEVTMNIVNIVLTFVLVRHFGLIGSSISFAINNIVFLLLMIFFSLKCIRNGSFKLISSELELATG
ncbi:MAG: Lipopolysaccharide biosynthesis protein, partial [uncultured bacterium]